MSTESRASFSATGEAVNFFGAPDDLQDIARPAETASKAEPASAASSAPVPPLVQSSSSLHSSPAMTVTFKNLRVEVEVPAKNGHEAHSRQILKGLNGEFRPGRLTAIMGASGSGKTTLLNVVSGRMAFKAAVGGEILVNGNPVTGDGMRNLAGYVYQDDVMLPTQTVREYLTMAAQLKLPDSISLDAKRARVEEVLDVLHLTKCADTIIGAPGITKEKGISGGEKRRVSVALELLTAPSILFNDEIVTGLDTFSAYSLLHILKSMCHHNNRTIVTVLHGPNSDMFHLFDDVILVAEGDIVYQGPVKEVVNYFARLGYPCPKYTNPADFIFTKVLNVEAIKKRKEQEAKSGKLEKKASSKATINEGSPAAGPTQEGQKDGTQPAGVEMAELKLDDREALAVAHEKAERERLDRLVADWKSSPECAAINQSVDATKPTPMPKSEIAGHQSSFFTQFRLLFVRAWQNQARNQLMLNAKIGQTVMISILCGLIYLRLGTSQKNIQDRTGALFFLAVNGMFSSVMGAQNTFISEQLVFHREYMSNLYGLPAYFFSRTAVELPFRILLPFIGGTISYFMIGFNEEALRWFVFCIVFVLLDWVGTSVGIFIVVLFPVLEVALTVGPAILLPLMLFSGYFKYLATLPPWFRWFAYVSPVKYAFVALVKNEFEGRTLKCTSNELTLNDAGVLVCPKTTGEAVIRSFAFDEEESIGASIGILIALAAAFIALSYGVMWRSVNKKKYSLINN